MANGVLDGTETMPSLHIAHVVTENINSEDYSKLTTLRAKLGDEAIIAFAKQKLAEMHASSILMDHFR